MEVRKVKTARFRVLVAQCGKPGTYTLWADPKADKSLSAAVRANRVLSVHQGAAGSPNDWAEVGLIKKPHITILVFPRSLKDFAGKRIVGIDYSLLEERTAPSKEKKTGSESKKSPASPRVKTAPKAGAAAKITPFPKKSPLDPMMLAAINAARKGLSEGGIPIGAALVRGGKLVATGHNKRVQDDDPVTHGETDCLRNAGRLGSYRGCTLYSTLMPCYFCAGAAIQFGIKKVIVGESRNFPGAPHLMRAHGIEVVDLDLPECYEMMGKFIEENPKLWNEDIGVD